MEKTGILGIGWLAKVDAKMQEVTALTEPEREIDSKAEVEAGEMSDGLKALFTVWQQARDAVEKKFKEGNSALNEEDAASGSLCGKQMGWVSSSGCA